MMKCNSVFQIFNRKELENADKGGAQKAQELINFLKAMV